MAGATPANINQPRKKEVMTNKEAPMNIFESISAISQRAGALAPQSKQGVPFPFRGVDGTVNHLAGFMQELGVIVVPAVQSAVTTSREAGSKTVKTTEVLVDFTFYAPDGSSVTATTAGLADDYADRSAAQAQSVAFRVALLQTFTLPTQTAEPEETGQHVQDTRDNTSQATVAAKPATVAAQLRSEIQAIVQNVDSGYTGDIVNALGDQLTGKSRAEWMDSAPLLKKVVAAIKNGEMPEVKAAA